MILRISEMQDITRKELHRYFNVRFSILTFSLNGIKYWVGIIKKELSPKFLPFK
jgi:hypothetical protein